MQTRAEKEVEKYKAIWAVKNYRQFSPGEKYASTFSEIIDCSQSIIDIGCGMGAGGLALRKIGCPDVTFLDHVLVNDQLDPFILTSLWDWDQNHNGGMNFVQGYCCDVMEHIPPEYVGLVLHRIRAHCDWCFFTIGLTEDHYGKIIQEELHLTVQSFRWWRNLLREFGEVIDARDLISTGMYYVKF